MQVAELLKPFWGDLLQNNIKNVKKFIRENRQKMDLGTARYTACAEGTALHLCAQHGFIESAKLMLDAGVGIDSQNKVGSTALHVACKFNQEEMVLFLLHLDARVLVPDMRNNIAFDVAPYSLLDKCLFIPLRASLAAEHQEEDQLLEIQQAAERRFDDCKVAEAYANMLVIDWESRAWEERQMLQTTMELDREWCEQVQRSKDQLEIKQAMYAELQRLLQKEQDQIALMWKNIVRDARNRGQRAAEELELVKMIEQEQEQHLVREHQDLLDECGLIEAAQEFPNDVDVQEWVLCMMTVMLEEAEAEHLSADQSLRTTSIDELLVREEMLSVIRNVLLRFTTVRDIQASALQCIVLLVRHCIITPDPPDQPFPVIICLQRSNFMKTLIKNNIMAITRDVLIRFHQDVELVHLGIELIYHLLRFRGDSGAHSLQFCQNRLTHQLPLQVFHLHEVAFTSQDDSDVFSKSSSSLTSTALLIARHQTAFLLFCLAKYNVRKALDKTGVLSMAHRLIFELTKNLIGKSDELKVSALRYLLGSLALAHSFSISRRVSKKTSPQKENQSSWSTENVSHILVAIRPWISIDFISSSKGGSIVSAYHSLVYWTMKLLRNLTSPNGNENVQLRIGLRNRETFDLFSDITLVARGLNQNDDNEAIGNIVVVWLELVKDIWLSSYNSDGQLATTASFVLDFFLKLLELKAQLNGSKVYGSELVEIAAVLRVIALILANRKNMFFLVEHENRIDAAVHALLVMLQKRKMQQEIQGLDDDEASALESLEHIIRIYLRFFDHERDEDNPTSHFHDRCRAVGICSTLQAYGLCDSKYASNPSANINQTDNKSTNSSGKLKTKMQLARTWSRMEIQQQSSHCPERDTICALARALLRQAPCHCNHGK